MATLSQSQCSYDSQSDDAYEAWMMGPDEEEMADAALELEIERMEAEQIYDEGEKEMTLQDIKDAIEAAIPNHGLIRLTHSMQDDDNYYSGTVHEISTKSGNKWDAPEMAQVTQVYSLESLLESITDSYSKYVPNKAARLEKLRRELEELEQMDMAA